MCNCWFCTSSDATSSSASSYGYLEEELAEVYYRASKEKLIGAVRYVLSDSKDIEIGSVVVYIWSLFYGSFARSKAAASY